MALSKIGDIDKSSGLKLIGETGTDTNKRQVVQRVNRVLTSKISAIPSTTIEPEKRYVAIAGGTYTLATIQGIYEISNQHIEKITVSANKFDGDLTSIELQPGQTLHSECSLVGANTVYTKLVTSPLSNLVTPSVSGDYKPPVSNNSLEPGCYYVATGGVYSIEAVNQTASQLPKEWAFWKITEGKASVFFQPGTATPIYFVKSGNWAISTNDLEIIVNKGQIVTIRLSAATEGDLVAISSAGIAHNKTVFYTIDVIEQPQTTSTSTVVKHNFFATKAPLGTNDNSEGYVTGSFWRTNTGFLWVAATVASGNAIWLPIARPLGSPLIILDTPPTDPAIDIFMMRSPINPNHPEGTWSRSSDANNSWIVQ